MGGRTWQTKSLAGRQAHSLYFTLMPELGLVGIIIFGTMIVLNYRDTRVRRFVPSELPAMRPRRENEQVTDPEFERAALFGNAILGGLLGYLITSAFISTLYYPTFWILMGLAVALRNTTRAYSVAGPNTNVSSPESRKSATWGPPRIVRVPR